MDYKLWTMAIEDLTNFCQGFSIPSKRAEVWFRELKNFTNDELRVGIDSVLKNHSRGSVDYRRLKAAMEKARRSMTGGIPACDYGQGYAPDSEAKTVFCKWHLAEFVKSESMGAQERLSHREKLRKAWALGYPKLPGYRSAEAVKEMYFAGRWQELLDLGAIPAMPQTRKNIFVPPLPSEKSQSTERFF